MPELGNFRWLTVGPAGQPDVAIVLMAIPGPPVMDDATAEQVRDLRPRASPAPSSSTRTTAQAAYEELKGRGVEFTEAPEERPYGIDCGVPRPVGQPPPAHAGDGGCGGVSGPDRKARIARASPGALELRDVPAVELEVLGLGSARLTCRGEAERHEPVRAAPDEQRRRLSDARRVQNPSGAVRLLELDVPRRRVEGGAARGA